MNAPRKIRTYFDLKDGTRSDVAGQLDAQRQRLHRRLADVRRTVAVMSGKGGVGKSLVTANLAATLAADGRSVGVVDADLNGPSMARLLGVPRAPLEVRGAAVAPGRGAAGVRVMSMDLLLAGEETALNWRGPQTDSFVWRGTLEANALREFLADTDWGPLDYLILDLPPGADRIGPVHDLVPDLDGVLAVTVPSKLSYFVVRKSLTVVRERGLPVVGYVVNMAGYCCPECGTVGPLFDATAETLEGVDRLATVPFDPELGRLTDEGRPYVLECPGAPASQAIRDIASAVGAFCEDGAA